MEEEREKNKEEESKKDKNEKLPLDARLLSEAVIELNILRRNVALYPSSHAIIKNSIKRTYELLAKLLDIRPEITLGIARDTLIVDEYTLDSANPIFKEFALSIHRKGIASITFISGVTEEEVITLHEFITADDVPLSKELVEYWERKGVRHIALVPIDFSTFKFVAGKLRKTGGRGPGEAIWQNYVYGLLEGRLAGEGEEALLSAPPEEIAGVFNEALDDESGIETYDHVISVYLRSRGGKANTSAEMLDKFLRFVENLKPELKKQFLSRASTHPSATPENIEETLKEMTQEEFDRMSEFFSSHASILPDIFKSLLDRLNELKAERPFYFDALYKGGAVFHDIEIDENFESMFDEAHFKEFVSEEYQRELERMLKSRASGVAASVVSPSDYDEITLNAFAADTMLEMLETPLLDREEYLGIITKLTEFITVFMETGRFEEILHIYNTIYSHTFTGKYSDEAKGTIEYFFKTDAFVESLVSSFNFWVRQNRESVIRLAKAFKGKITVPMLEALSSEQDAMVRKSLLQVLTGMGPDILPEVVKRLSDKKWYVVRNMIFLIRETGGKKYLQQVRHFARHKDKRISIEALNTLLHFGTTDSVSYLRFYIDSDNPEMSDYAVRTAGKYRVRGVVPELLSMLEKRDLLGSVAYYKIPVVKALGQIGDERAVPTLTKLYKTKMMFYKNYVDELRKEIIRSLFNYPPGSIKELAEEGLKSDDKDIKLMSEELYKRSRGARGRA